MIDGIANAAFYYGLANYLANQADAPEMALPFATARDNFYACARSGLKGHVTWLDGSKGRMKQLLQHELLDAAEQGLHQMELSADDISLYIGIIRERVETEQHGASWQRKYMDKHRCDMQTLTAAYSEHQQTGEPVHLWSL